MKDILARHWGKVLVVSILVIVLLFVLAGSLGGARGAPTSDETMELARVKFAEMLPAHGSGENFN